MSSLHALAEGIQSQFNTAVDNQGVQAYFAISLAMSFLELNTNWIEQLQLDANTYMTDAMKAASEPDKMSPAVPAADSMKKTMDTNESDFDTGKMQTLLETVKSKAQQDANATDNTFKLATPMLDFMNTLTTLINTANK
jgi:hypothetical protein